MRTALSLALAAGMTVGLAGTASACNWNKTAEKKMTVAEAEPVEEAVTTFDPVDTKQLDEKVADED